MKSLLITFIIIAVFISSCIPTRNLTIDKLQPAEISFPKDVNSILVLNASYIPSIDTLQSSFIRLLEPKELAMVDTIVINNVFNGLFSVLDQTPASFLNNAPYYENRGTSTENFLEPLSATSIEYLCDSFEVDAIISFEYYSLQLEIDTDQYLTEDGDYWYVTDLEMVRDMLWRIYDQEQGIIDEKLMQDTLYWSADGASGSMARKNLAPISEMIREAFWFGGEKYAAMITPSWSEAYRTFFNIRDRKGADISLEPEKLKEFAEEGNKIKAYKASYNLALYYEMNDQFREAIRWINKAIYLRPSSSLPPWYKRQLEQRLKEAEKLNEQMNF